MLFYWLCKKMAHKQLGIYWQPGSMNYADYYTKHHPTIYHKKMREIMYRLQTAIHAYKRKLARVCQYVQVHSLRMYKFTYINAYIYWP